VRALLIIALASSLPLLAQPDADAQLESLLAAARRAQARSDFRSAAGAYRQAVALRPGIAELWSNLGLMQYQSGDHSGSAEAFRKALQLNASLFVPNLFLGLDLLQLKRPRDAVAFLMTAEKLNPQDPQPAVALGRAYHAAWEPEKSRQWYERAIALAPRNGDAWYGLGLAYFGLAEAAGAKLTTSFHDSAYVAELSANALAEQGRLTEAIHAYRALFADHADPPRCSHSSYGLVLIRNGDPAEAEAEFRRDLDSCPAARIGMARLQAAGAAREKPRAMTADLPNAAPEPSDAALLEPAHPVPESAGAPELARIAGDAFFSGHFRTAALAGERLRQKYPNDAAGWYWAVRADQKLGVAALARAGEVEPDSPAIHALLGDVYRRRRMFDEARAEYERMLAVSPESVAALAGLAATYRAESKLNEARITAEKALRQSPSDGEINLLMGDILVAQQEYEKAEPYLEGALQARPDLLPRVHALRGLVFAMAGRPKEAIRELTQGLASDEDGSVHYQLARLYQEAGDTKAAAAAFEKSKQIRARHDTLAQEALTPIQ
jgi:tetratricopeptide (TPR) repeat protein